MPQTIGFDPPPSSCTNQCRQQPPLSLTLSLFILILNLKKNKTRKSFLPFFFSSFLVYFRFLFFMMMMSTTCLMQVKTCRRNCTLWPNKRRWQRQINNLADCRRCRWAAEEDRSVSTARQPTRLWVLGKVNCSEVRAPTLSTLVNRDRCVPSIGDGIKHEK